MEEKRKIFYDKETGIIDIKPFFDDIDENDTRPFIELTYEEWCDKLQCSDMFFNKVYKNGEIIEEFDESKRTEYEEFSKEQEIEELKTYLNDTDYVISKLNEAKLLDEEEFNKLKVEYNEVLKKRKEARIKINNEEAV